MLMMIIMMMKHLYTILQHIDSDVGDDDDVEPINHPSARAASKALKFSLISSAWYSSVKTWMVMMAMMVMVVIKMIKMVKMTSVKI